MAAAKGNRHAAKPDGEMDARMDMRCWGQDKKRWIKAANAEGMKLAPWVARTLNEAAKPR